MDGDNQRGLRGGRHGRCGFMLGHLGVVKTEVVSSELGEEQVDVCLS